MSVWEAMEAYARAISQPVLGYLVELLRIVVGNLASVASELLQAFAIAARADKHA